MKKIPLKDSLAFNISRAGTLLRRHLTRTLSHYNITPEQWQIIATLWQSDNPICQKEIAASLLKDKHAVSRMIKKMETNGWIEKGFQKGDSRVTLVCLTDKGLEAAEEMYEKLAVNVRSKIFNHFSPSEKNQLKSLITRLVDIMETMD